jgi:hypothetical protein
MDKGEIIIYQTESGQTKLEVNIKDETVWLTQKAMGQLFDVESHTITYHLKEIYKSGELDENATARKIRAVQTEGKREVARTLDFYNLDCIISVGYRVNSYQATQFRIWATQRLKEYIVKGFALNDDRFKTGNSMNYFNELQERIREIRLSERFFYQKIKDIYTTSIDYNPKDEKSIEFFKIVQNKLLWAISSQTAAELVYSRTNASLPLMGMQSYDKKNVVKIRKSDVSIAKNYLNEDEIKLLGLLVEQYLAFAETMAQQHTPMYMADWIEQLDVILKMNKRELLSRAGEISHQKAIEKSSEEYKKYICEQKQIEKVQNLKELEQDIKKIKAKK